MILFAIPISPAKIKAWCKSQGYYAANMRLMLQEGLRMPDH